jgi:hypothetical protein
MFIWCCWFSCSAVVCRCLETHISALLQALPHLHTRYIAPLRFTAAYYPARGSIVLAAQLLQVRSIAAGTAEYISSNHHIYTKRNLTTLPSMRCCCISRLQAARQAMHPEACRLTASAPRSGALCAA